MNESDHEKLHPGTTLTFRLEEDSDGKLPEIFTTVRKDAEGVFLDIQVEALEKQKKLSVEGIRAHKGEVKAMELSGDRNFLFSSGKDAMKTWKVNGENLEQILGTSRVGGCDTTTIATSKDAKTVAWGSEDPHYVRVKTASNSIIPYKIEEKHDDSLDYGHFFLSAVAMSPDGKLLVTTGWGMDVLLWKAPYSKTSKPKVLLEQPRTHSARFSLDGKLLAVGHDSSGMVSLWNTDSLDWPPRELEADRDIRMLAFSNDNQLLAAGNNHNQIMLSKITESGKFEELGSHHCGPYSEDFNLQTIAFSPNDALLASGGAEESSIILWNVEERQQLCRIPTEQEEVISLAFLDDEHLLSAGKDGTFKIWNLRHIMEVSHLLD